MYWSLVAARRSVALTRSRLAPIDVEGRDDTALIKAANHSLYDGWSGRVSSSFLSLVTMLTSNDPSPPFDLVILIVLSARSGWTMPPLASTSVFVGGFLYRAIPATHGSASNTTYSRSWAIPVAPLRPTFFTPSWSRSSMTPCRLPRRTGRFGSWRIGRAGSASTGLASVKGKLPLPCSFPRGVLCDHGEGIFADTIDVTVRKYPAWPDMVPSSTRPFQRNASTVLRDVARFSKHMSSTIVTGIVIAHPIAANPSLLIQLTLASCSRSNIAPSLPDVLLPPLRLPLVPLPLMPPLMLLPLVPALAITDTVSLNLPKRRS